MFEETNKTPEAIWRELVIRQLENAEGRISKIEDNNHALEVRLTKELNTIENKSVSKSDISTIAKNVDSVEDRISNASSKIESLETWKKEADEKLKKHERYVTVVITTLAILNFLMLFFKDAIVTAITGGGG